MESFVLVRLSAKLEMREWLRSLCKCVFIFTKSYVFNPLNSVITDNPGSLGPNIRSSHYCGNLEIMIIRSPTISVSCAQRVKQYLFFCAHLPIDEILLKDFKVIELLKLKTIVIKNYLIEFIAWFD